MSAHPSSRRPGGGRGGVKALITVGAMAATALGWVLYGQTDPAEGAGPTTPEGAIPPEWADLLAPMPTLVPPGDGIASLTGPSSQPVLRTVTLPTVRKSVTVTRSSR